MSTKPQRFDGLSWPWRVAITVLLIVGGVAVGLMPRLVHAILLSGVFLSLILVGLGIRVYAFLSPRRLEQQHPVGVDDPLREASTAAHLPFGGTEHRPKPSSSPASDRPRMAIVCLWIGTILAALLAGVILFNRSGPIRDQLALDVFVLLFLGLNAGALYGVAHRLTWGRLYGTIAAIAWCSTGIGMALGIPMLIGLRRLPPMTWLGSEIRS
jgi:hypothetical protein